MRIQILAATMLCLLGTMDAVAQQIIRVGRGSYAAYTPLSMSRTNEHGGDQSQYMQ